MHHGTNKTHLILVLGLLTAIGPLSIDLYLPAFPQIARGLHTTVARVVLSLSSFFVGISAGQLLYGPLLERFGRKKPLYAGLSLYLIASVVCAFVASVDALILFRFLQALGGCVGMVAARAVVRDLFDGPDLAKVFSTLMLVVAVSPIVAPTAGGYVAAAFGWRATFFVLAGMALVMLAGVHFVLPESKGPDPAFSLKPRPILALFGGILGHPQFYTYALAGAVSYAGLYAYVSGAPYVFMERFGVNETQFGWIFAFIAMGLIGASQLNTVLLGRYSSERITRTASLVQSLLGVALVGLTLLGWLGLFGTVLLIFLFLGCQGLVFPNASALALTPFARQAGSASALLGALQMGIGAGASALVSALQNHTALPMTGVMAGCAVTALVLFSWGGRVSAKRTAR